MPEMTGKEILVKKARDFLDQWMHAVNHADVEKLLSLYDKTAVLIPTFSNKILNTPEKMREYFTKLAEREGLSITLHEKSLYVQSLDNEMSIINGIYNWRFKVDGEPLNFEARFSYVIDCSRPGPILHHHSSQVPRMI